MPGTVTVHTREELDRNNVNTIKNLVRYEPGVSVGGAGQVYDELVSQLKKAGLSDADARESMYYFVELLRSRHHFQAAVNIDYVVSDEELTAHVARAVRI